MENAISLAQRHLERIPATEIKKSVTAAAVTLPQEPGSTSVEVLKANIAEQQRHLAALVAEPGEKRKRNPKAGKQGAKWGKGGKPTGRMPWKTCTICKKPHA
mmetsp:Transcript_24528/g.49688  ORF Transcript_24528/g.49688 Transcript_24528/m.49688 type:complete len:102 (+) Transcript_24528:536-841(+)